MAFFNMFKKQVWLMIFLLIVIIMFVDLVSRISTLNYLGGQRETLVADVVNLKETKDVIGERINYAQSDSAMEEWARVQGLMALPNDYVIIPVEIETLVPTAVVLPTVQVTPSAFWDVWKTVLFE